MVQKESITTAFDKHLRRNTVNAENGEMAPLQPVAIEKENGQIDGTESTDALQSSEETLVQTGETGDPSPDHACETTSAHAADEGEPVTHTNGGSSAGEVVFLDPATIKTHPELEVFLPRDNCMSDGIRQDMASRRFDPAYPICLAKGPWTEEPVVWDGHTRRQLAQELRIAQVPCVVSEFESIDAVIDRMIYAQAHRRPLTDSLLLEIVEKRDQRKQPGRKKSGSNEPHCRSAKQLAELCGVSESTIKRARKVVKHDGTGQLRRQVRDGEITLHKALESVEAQTAGKKCTPGNRDQKTGQAKKEKKAGPKVGKGGSVSSSGRHAQKVPKTQKKTLSKSGGRRLTIQENDNGMAIVILGYDKLSRKYKKMLRDKLEAVVAEIEAQAFGK